MITFGSRLGGDGRAGVMWACLGRAIEYRVTGVPGPQLGVPHI